jgi:thiol-disulfide isomerase/thioredoxin
VIGAAVVLGAAVFAGAEAVDVASGKPARLDPPERGVVHVAVFATWCPPCVEEIDRLSEWEARYGAEGYRLVVLAVPERQSLDKIRRFHAARPLPGRLLWDATGAALRALDAERVPAHILIVPGGRVAWRGAALAELGESGLEAVIEGRVPGEEPR